MKPLFPSPDREGARGLCELKPRGVAILMVIAVLAGLMALAAPFVLSMVLHGRTARGDLNALQARLGSEAATSHALAQLVKNTTRYDPSSGQLPLTILSDLKVTMDFPAADREFGKLGVNVQNQKGQLWSAKVEDEQAKINLTTVPPVLLGNLLGSAILLEPAERGAGSLVVDDGKQFNPSGGSVSLVGEREALHYSAVQGNVIALTQGTDSAHAAGALVFDGRAKLIADYKIRSGGPVFTPFRSNYEIKLALSGSPVDALRPDEFARIERHLTVQSGMNGPLWGRGEHPAEQGAVTVGGFSVEKGDGFTPGGLVRIVENGVPQNYARVRRVHIRPNNTAFVELDFPLAIGTQGNERYVQPEMRHPINVNTATPEVLEACFMGLCLAGGKEPVRRQTAQLLADFVRSQRSPLIDTEGVRKLLEQAYAKGILIAPQRDAVYINATEPNSPKLRTSTVPFCFCSYGSYTIEGTGVVNAENGLQLSRHTTRQLLTMPIPWPGYFKVEFQAGFERLLDQGMGSRVVTFPTVMGKSKYKRKAPSVKLPSEQSGGVRLDVGECGPHKAQGDPSEFIEHCEDEKDPAYRQDGYDMSRRGPFVLPEPQNQPRIGPNGLASQPTAVELWYKPTRSGQCVFYDESLEEDRNRITFAYDPSKEGLLVQVYDAGYECQDANKKDWTHLKRKPVEFLYPISLDAGEWYHVAAEWKTGRPNGQAIRVDALSKPKGEELKCRPGVKLASALSLTETESLELEELEEDTDFPKAGAVLIGEEIVEYYERNGTSLQKLVRGSRMSAVSKHKQGEIVMPYGFSVNLGQDLAVGNGTLVERLERPSLTRTRVRYPSPPNKINFILNTDVTKIPVDDATNFPKSGFISVGGELIFYGKRTATTFEQLQRGLGDGRGRSTPRNIGDGAGVALACLTISDYSQYDDVGIVQIDDDQNEKKVEWIAYGSRQSMDGKNFLVSRLWWDSNTRARNNLLSVGNPVTRVEGMSCGIGEFRDEFGVGRYTLGRESAHEKKAKCIPVIRMGGPHCGNFWSPYGDQGVSEVSIVERGSTSGELMWVKQGFVHQWANTNSQPCPQHDFVSWGFDYYVGLNDFVSRRYPGNQTRFLKWPSGELPDAVGARRYVGADRNQEGKLTGYVDEVKVNTFNTYGARIAMTTEGTGISSGDQDILLEEHTAWPYNHDGANANLNWPTTGGLVRIEDELLFYKACAPGAFQFYSDVYPYLKEGDNPNGKPEQSKAGRVWYWPCTKPPTPRPHPNIKNKTGLRLTGVQRGVLGTKAVDHPVGAQALLLDGMAVSLLRGNLAPDGDSFSVANAAGFPKEGYAVIDNEVVSWLDNRNGSFTGCRHFHGRYGTQPGGHDQDTIVRCLPFRYWDREAKFYDGDGLAYIQAGYVANDAIWDGIQLVLTGTEDRPRPRCVLPRVLLRFDGNPNWDVEVTNQDGGLYEFRGKDGVIKLKSSRVGGVHANQVEMRVYWEFRPGAYKPDDARASDWKHTFTIEKMRATYYTPLLMRRLDEVEKR